MSNINNNINWVYKNGTTKYINQDQLNNLSDYQKNFLACKCGKKPEFRWIKSENTESYGLFYGISPFKGRNNEELCHKCANFCYHCGREENRYEWSYDEDTEDNPSGRWIVRCCPQCWDKYSNRARPGCYGTQQKYEEIKLGSKNWNERESKKEENARNCDYCGKLFKGKTEYFCSSCGTFYCSKDCCEASDPQCKNKISNNKPQMPVENSKVPAEGNEKDKPKSVTESSKNSPENDKILPENSDKNENSGKNNSPQPVIKSSSEENQRSSEFLVINLKKAINNACGINIDPQRDIKQIALTSDGNLIIEFNNSASNHSIGQVITSEQINNNQELQKIKNYCQQNGKNSLSQQELNSLINGNKTSAPTNKTKNDNNNTLAIGLVAAFALIVGLVIGLVVKRKKRN